MANSQFGITRYSWWIGGILGLIIGLSNPTQGSDGIGISAYVGIVNGVFLGWLVGFVIDKLSKTSSIQNITKKAAEARIEGKLIKQTQSSLEEYNTAKNRFRYLSKETLINKYQNFINEEKSDMERLALEEELVKRGVLDFSPMHEKLEKINENINFK